MCTFNIYSKFNTFAAAGCSIVGIILLMISIFSMEWSHAKTSKSSKGLWTYKYDDLSFTYRNSEITSTHHMTRALAMVAIVTGWASLLLSPLHTMETLLGLTLSRQVHFCIAVVAFHTAMGSWICSVLAMLVWGFTVHDMQQYFFGPGFVICLMGAFLMLMGGLEVFNASMIQHPKHRPSRLPSRLHLDPVASRTRTQTPRTQSRVGVSEV